MPTRRAKAGGRRLPALCASAWDEPCPLPQEPLQPMFKPPSLFQASVRPLARKPRSPLCVSSSPPSFSPHSSWRRFQPPCLQEPPRRIPLPSRRPQTPPSRPTGRPPLVREGLRAGGEATAQFSLSAMNAESRGVRRTARARRPAGRHPGSMPPRTGAGGSRLLAGFSPAQAGCTAPDAHGMKGVLAWQTTQSNRHPGSQPASPRRKAGSADICADICVPAP